MVSRLRFILTGWVSVVVATAALATSVIAPEFPELVQGSDYIIRGRVIALRNEIQMREGREVPFTRVVIAVRELIVGEAPAQVELTMLGGRTSDGGELSVAGAPQFQVGEEDILFVSGNGINFHPLKALMHGRYPVRYDKKLRREYVTRADGVPLAATAEVALPLAEGKVAELLRRHRNPQDALTPQEFKQSIREVRGARLPAEGGHAK
jgi:hypothetical protein